MPQAVAEAEEGVGVISQYVQPGVCLHCGHKKQTWSPKRVVNAAQRWYETHGEPPRAVDWSRGTPDHPAPSSVYSLFGNWNTMLTAAGLPTRRPGPGPYWNRERVIEAMLDWLFANGRWPTSRDWKRSGGNAHPEFRVVKDRFGSWEKAKRAAGWRPKDELASIRENYKRAQRLNARQKKEAA